jgi:hypothetical protein
MAYYQADLVDGQRCPQSKLSPREMQGMTDHRKNEERNGIEDKDGAHRDRPAVEFSGTHVRIGMAFPPGPNESKLTNAGSLASELTPDMQANRKRDAMAVWTGVMGLEF